MKIDLSLAIPSWRRLTMAAALFSVLLWAAAEARADPLTGQPAGEKGAGIWLWEWRAADNALRLGFASVAASIYDRLLADWPEERAGREEAELSLAAALLAGRRVELAAELLEAHADDPSPRWWLRRALLDFHRRDWPGLQSKLEAFEEGDLGLPEEERAWVPFLQAVTWERAGRSEEAAAAYDLALETAVSENQRAAFMVSRHRILLVTAQPDEELAEQLKARMQEFQGRSAGFRFAQQYSVVLDALGRKQEAVEVILRTIQTIPTADRELRDQFLLLNGLIAGSDSGPGRESLRQLLETGGSRELQRIALHKLALGGASGPGPVLELVNRLIEENHSLEEELLVFRAQIRLRSALGAPVEERAKYLTAAMEDARDLLTRFPGSRLTVDALELKAISAWERRQYRTAANHLNQLREALPPGRRRADTGLLVADSYFRAGEINKAVEDYRNAADAYGAVLRERPASVAPGLLLFQRVLAEIRGGRLTQAEAHLQEAADMEGFDPLHRWQAEWNLVKAMQQAGRMEEAFQRSLLFSDDLPENPEGGELALRLAWLRAQLAFDTDRHEEALPVVRSVLEEAVAEKSPMRAEDRDRAVAHALLLQGRILLAMDQAEEALPLLARLREEFPGSDPAIFSHLVEGRYYTSVNRTVDAQQRLISLADSHPGTSYAPVALFEAAINAQRRGQETAYQEQAINLFERLVREYAGHELAFHARLRQGDLLRQLNRFEDAEAVYLSLENSMPNHPDLPLVLLSLADCHLAQAARGAEGRWELAAGVLERLFDLPGTSVDFRAEAGFKLAFANLRRGRPGLARDGFWLTVSTLLLENPDGLPGPRGRYWLARSFLEYARIQEEDGRVEQAREAYRHMVNSNLPGRSLAESNLARLQVQSSSQ